MKGGNASTEKMSFRSNSSSSSSYPSGRRCKCGEKLLFFTSNSMKNPGRSFWRCPFWNTQRTCKFFQWADEEVEEERSLRYEKSVDDLKMKNAKLKSKVVAERKAGSVWMCLVVCAGTVSFVVMVYASLKCNCSV
ncbi:Zinc finger, GRF-type [Sesbania bispinosa]|nr:Zinc finger, GRF-type [Sesbania bispinosa]